MHIIIGYLCFVILIVLVLETYVLTNNILVIETYTLTNNVYVYLNANCEFGLLLFIGLSMRQLMS